MKVVRIEEIEPVPVVGGELQWRPLRRTLGIEAFALFLIVFLWQFPHFLAIAWIYREDYARGGMKMLPEVDPHGALTGRQATCLPKLIGVCFIKAQLFEIALRDPCIRGTDRQT